MRVPRVVCGAACTLTPAPPQPLSPRKQASAPAAQVEPRAVRGGRGPGEEMQGSAHRRRPQRGLGPGSEPTLRSQQDRGQQGSPQGKAPALPPVFLQHRLLAEWGPRTYHVRPEGLPRPRMDSGGSWWCRLPAPEMTDVGHSEEDLTIPVLSRRAVFCLSTPDFCTGVGRPDPPPNFPWPSRPAGEALLPHLRAVGSTPAAPASLLRPGPAPLHPKGVCPRVSALSLKIHPHVRGPLEARLTAGAQCHGAKWPRL